MARYAQGQPVTVSTEVRLAPVPPATVGVLTTPGSILLRVKRPDGTFIPDYTSPVADAVGKYHVDLPSADLTQLGPYAYAWVTTGTAAGVSPAGSFQVVDPFAASHLTFADARARLNLTASSDDEVQDMIASAVSEQEQRVGAIAPRTVTETVTASCGRLWLSTRPVLAVTGATVSGVAQVVSGWRVGLPMAGDVSRTDGTALYGTYVVTYTAGRNPVPQDLVEAGLLRVQHSYESQRGAADTAFSDQTEGSGGSAFLLLLRAQDKEKPYVLPSIA